MKVKNVLVGVGVLAVGVAVGGGLYYNQNSETGEPVTVEQLNDPFTEPAVTPELEVTPPPVTEDLEVIESETHEESDTLTAGAIDRAGPSDG